MLDNSDKKWPWEWGELDLNRPGKFRHVHLFLRIMDGRHSGPAFSARDLNPVNDSVFELDHVADNSLHLSRADIFTAPPLKKNNVKQTRLVMEPPIKKY